MDKDKKVRIFICYARQDEDSCHELVSQLGFIGWDRDVDIFIDKFCEKGDKWKNTIRTKIRDADIIVFLVSQNFSNSTFIKKFEFPLAWTKCETGEAIGLPVILTNTGIPLKLQELQCVYSHDGKPILDSADRSLAWCHVVAEISKHVERLQKARRENLLLTEEVRVLLSSIVKEASSVWLCTRTGLGWNKDDFLHHLLEKKQFKAKILFLNPKGKTFRNDSDNNYKPSSQKGFAKAESPDQRQIEAEDLHRKIVREGHFVRVADILLPRTFWAIGEADCETPTVAFIETQMHLADYDGNLYLPASRGDSNIRAYQAIFEQLWKQATPAIEA
ncbi:toll/interleukin-1 receptor domain-containing protein [Candidatus Accumulibacter sp. ACC012]|jgi:hypothetical protein|uniref:toll/interleukin-1 receptor domain-containing protein n=1 Tax=Candidatus Accumulibacter sp. ACC012 TaxID=2823332 RepID=UPI0025BC5481|nr:toll/interleukin-1 receptor domain-containing protein [Candidatus Accumulibacter sp. ACC012]